MATELPEAQQRLGKLLFDFGKHASGTAMDQYCEMAMLLARELLSDPDGWAKALHMPPPEPHTEEDLPTCPECGSPVCEDCGGYVGHFAYCPSQNAHSAHQTVPVK